MVQRQRSQFSGPFAVTLLGQQSRLADQQIQVQRNLGMISRDLEGLPVAFPCLSEISQGESDVA
jgi:hypothetical protein